MDFFLQRVYRVSPHDHILETSGLWNSSTADSSPIATLCLHQKVVPVPANRLLLLASIRIRSISVIAGACNHPNSLMMFLGWNPTLCIGSLGDCFAAADDWGD